MEARSVRGIIRGGLGGEVGIKLCARKSKTKELQYLTSSRVQSIKTCATDC